MTKTKLFQFSNGYFLVLRSNVLGTNQFKFGFSITDDPLKAQRFETAKELDIIPFLNGRFVTLKVKVTHE